MTLGRIILCICLFFSVSLFAMGTKQVLVINSYHKGFKWSDDLIDGIEKVFKNQLDVDMTILYMDSKRISSKEYYRTLRDLYKLQLKNRKYDLVLLIDLFAFNFALEHYHEFFTDERLVFAGIEQYFAEEVIQYGLKDRVSGVMEKRAIEDIIKMIHKMMPSLKKLYILNDRSANGDDSDPFIKHAIDEVNGDFDVEYIRHGTMDGFKEKFKEKRPNEAIFFVRFYNGDNQEFYKNAEIEAMIDASALPVFVTDELFLERGPVGGKLLSVPGIGTDTGEMALELLQNPNVDPRIIVSNRYEYIFDYEKIKKFHLNPSLLSQPFRYVKGPLSFFDKYRDFINVVFILSPLLIMLIVGLVHNLYLRIQSSKALKQRMAFDQLLLDAIDNPIVWQDQDGKIVDSNARFCDLMGLPCPETKGRTLKEYVDKNNAQTMLKALKAFVNSSKNENEVVLKDHDKKDKIYLINQADYTEDIYKTTGTVTIFTDITKERKALEEKIKHQEFIIQQSKLAEIGEIFSSIAHQWKSPLVEIATVAQEQLYNNEGEVDEENNTFVNDIMVQVQYMTDTINDFQEFIMPSTKKVAFDIKDAIVRMMEIVRHNMKYNYIDVYINVSKGASLTVLGYKNELMQTMLNIVNNAKEAILKAREVKKCERGKIDISIFNRGSKVFIEIEDNGGGINEAAINKIFDPYFSTKEKGHGIGLYMAKLIIEDKMGGKIHVVNARLGAQFCIELEQYHENISVRR